MQRKQQIPTSEALGFSQGNWSLGASWVFDFRKYAFAEYIGCPILALMTREFE